MIKHRWELDEMPFDKVFHTENGRELCHATGYEVTIEYDGGTIDWWYEYEDSNGELHYGR